MGYRFFLFITSIIVQLCFTGYTFAQDTTHTDSVQYILDTVFLVPDTIVEEEIIYIEYEGTPYSYLTIDFGSHIGTSNYTNSTSAFNSGIHLGIQQTINRFSLGLHLKGEHEKWNNEFSHTMYSPYEYDETYTVVIDSFGRVVNGDTTWNNITEERIRRALDSTAYDTVISEIIQSQYLSIPVSIGFEFIAGYFFTQAYYALSPTILLSQKTSYEQTGKSPPSYTESSASFLLLSEVGLRCNYLIHPQWILSFGGYYQFQLSPKKENTRPQKSSLMGSLGLRYILKEF